jgi:hypothetical protein
LTEYSDSYLAEWIDNDQLIMARVALGSMNLDLFLLDLDSGEQMQLTLSPETEESFPSWTP